MRRATDGDYGQTKQSEISIHALHEESDAGKVDKTASAPISIHALHEESDPVRLNPFDGNFLFQSTLSMRRATHRDRHRHVC